MMRLVTGCLFLIGTATALASGSQVSRGLDSFSIILERDGSRWSARCERGCTFQSVSTTTRAIETPMHLDAHGLRTAATAYSEPSPFGFDLIPRGRGWEATKARGTVWTVLAFDCGNTPCRARVTELGVSAIQ